MKPLALVVENDANTRKLLEVLLSRFGFELDLVSTACDAMLLLRAVEYDALFVDLLIPGTNGFDILELIGDEKPELLSRTLVLSGAAESVLRRVAYEWPRVRVIRKPFELGELLETAQRFTAERPARKFDALESFTRHSVRSGAKAGIVVRRNASLGEPVFSFGYEPGVLESFFPMPLDAPFPICIAMRHAKPVWLASLARATPEYPMLVPVWQQHKSHALATVPLTHDGVTIGAAGWSFREPRLFSEPEQQEFLSIANSLAGWLGQKDQRAPQDQSASAASV